jgi:PhnB protein
MAQTATYLNFERETEEVFNYYKSVFRTEFMNGIVRFRDIPTSDDYPGPSEEDKDLIINVALPITGGHVLMGTDAPETMGFKLNQGNNVHICLMPDTRAESDRLFAALSDGGEVEMPMSDMFWGDYYGAFTDKYGVHWMINCSEKS